MVILERGFPESVPSASIFLTMSIPSTTSPKTTCFPTGWEQELVISKEGQTRVDVPSNQEVTTVVMKN